MAAARPHHSLSRALTRALLPWIAMLWVTAAGAVGWYLQHELSEQLDAGLVESAERLLDLAAHDARRKEAYDERTQVNREVKGLAAQLGAMTAPAELKSRSWGAASRWKTPDRS